MDVNELLGVTLGTCTLERIIGRGGMGAVFLAQQSRPVRTVAVKVLIPSLSYDPEEQRNFLERFRREADTVARLEHKNILPIYEYDEALVGNERLAYLVMPYMRGGTLRDRIDEMKREGRHFDLRIIVSYMSQLADALNYAHNFGIVHRDVKPANLLFHLDGRLLLSDFGIVRLETLPALTAIGDFLGTVEYASPEQVSTSEVDQRSDIYSMGVVLYELLTGDVPFTGTTPFIVMNKHLSEPVPLPSKRRPDLPPAVEEVVLKALAKRPEDRYQSALELAAALRSAVLGASPAPASGVLRISGNADNSDLTVAEPVREAVSEVVGAGPKGRAGGPSPEGRTPWQQGPRPWEWPSQQQVQEQLTPPVSPDEETEPAPIFHEGRRLFYYSLILIALVAQFPILALLYGLSSGKGLLLADLGVLLATGVNLLTLAALGFCGVTRSSLRNVRGAIYRTSAASLIALAGATLLVGLTDAAAPWLPLLAYILLLGSNIYAVRQLGQVDVAHDQVEVAPVHWRAAAEAALTGLLPLTIILILTFATSAQHLFASHLLNMLGLLLIALVAAPTPGAVVAIETRKLSTASFIRTSACAGLFMFLAAFLLASAWGLLIARQSWFFVQFNPPWIALLLWAGLLALIGSLRGLLDAYLYLRMTPRSP
ncbi:serine/threonine-protein kinase [Thermogemmatispora onikobensis]|uniref:serine/threonine-protein kinase n=1 Tax=Thermogemmatispora onikobensis TaxID=732234 RepID=UPI000852BEFB|nr:serine/threonine-protein kinase [Thermogemmatispora onikobensis]